MNILKIEKILNHQQHLHYNCKWTEDDYYRSGQSSGYEKAKSEFMATQDEQHKDDGYYVINGKGYWLCKPIDTSTLSKTPLTAEIITESYEIYNQLEPVLFMAKFYDANGNEVNVEHEWTITSDFTDALIIDIYENTISISVDNKALVNKSFILSLSADGYETVSKTITIKAFI